jgi:hypothetical protein
MFNALGNTLAVLALPESSFEALRRDEMLSVWSFSANAALFKITSRQA